MKGGEIHFAGRNQEVAVNQVDNAIGEIGREVRAGINAAILAQSARDVDARKALGERELDIRVSLVVAQQDVEARLPLLDEMVLERERFLVIGDDNVVDIHGLARPACRSWHLPSGPRGNSETRGSADSWPCPHR